MTAESTARHSKRHGYAREGYIWFRLPLDSSPRTCAIVWDEEDRDRLQWRWNLFDIDLLTCSGTPTTSGDVHFSSASLFDSRLRIVLFRMVAREVHSDIENWDVRPAQPGVWNCNGCRKSHPSIYSCLASPAALS
jgi:hypothetical protein